MAFDVKSEILAAIGKTDDANMKLVLLMMLGVVEEIGGKIDAWRADEQSVRIAVLNGHEPVHHAHHEWIARQIRREEEDAVENRNSARKIRDGLIERFLWVAVVFVLGAGLLMK